MVRGHTCSAAAIWVFVRHTTPASEPSPVRLSRVVCGLPLLLRFVAIITPYGVTNRVPLVTRRVTVHSRHKAPQAPESGVITLTNHPHRHSIPAAQNYPKRATCVAHPT